MHRALLILFLLLPACTGTPGRAIDPVDASAGLGPFVPMQMRIHPLSHVELHPGIAHNGVQEHPLIITYLEFTDRWYDTAKAVGLVQAQLYRSGGAGLDVQQAKWDVDLADLNANAEWFDPVTRTYRFQLNLPEWARENLGQTCRLVIVFTPAGQENTGRGTMRDEMLLRSEGPGTPMPESVGFPDTSSDFVRSVTAREKPKPVDPADAIAPTPAQPTTTPPK